MPRPPPTSDESHARPWPRPRLRLLLLLHPRGGHDIRNVKHRDAAAGVEAGGLAGQRPGSACRVGGWVDSPTRRATAL